jgi:hypothetical protein
MSSTHLLVACLCVLAPIRSAAAGEWWLAGGAGFDPAGLESWQAVTSAPAGSLKAAGARLSLFLSERGSADSARLEGGWSFAAAGLSGDIMGGVEARQQDERTRLTPVITAMFETAGGGGGIASLAMVRPAFGEVWLEVRPWLDLGHGRRLGALAAGAPGTAEPEFRAGLFGSGYRLVLPTNRELFLGGELGLAGDRCSRGLSPFAGLNLGFDL